MKLGEDVEKARKNNSSRLYRVLAFKRVFAHTRDRSEPHNVVV